MANRLSMKAALNEIHVSEEIHELSSEEVKLLQNTMLDMYSDIFTVCKKNGLKLFLQGGTLLGHVRHHGFIPWDDDMDLGMMRVHYDKLIEIFDEELSDRYELKAPGYHGGAVTRFIHIYKKDSYLETLDSRPDTPKMVSIDIFPIDYAPANKVHRVLKGIYCNGLMFVAGSMEFIRYCTPEVKKELIKTPVGKLNYYIRKVTADLFRFYSLEKMYVKVDHAVKGRRKTAWLTSSVGRRHYLGELQSAKTFIPLRRCEFCGREALTIHNERQYLLHNYGEHYMDVPPVEKREKHFVKRMEL